jgi:membrane protease subunit (stomatin/prohibitin family)
MAQMGVGMGVAAMYAQGAAGHGAPQFNPAAAAAGAAAAGGVAVQCPGCHARVAPGKFCAECGTPLATGPKKCAGCNAELAPNAKFCPECGTRA